MSLQEEIKRAIGAHGMWKARLAKAIETGKSETPLADVATDDHCDFGRWLHGDHIPVAAKQSADYKECRALHAQFHQTAAEVLRIGLAGDKVKAHAALAPTGKFGEISGKLTAAMMKWIKNTPA